MVKVTRGDIWLATLNTTIGVEIHKTRPHLIVSPPEIKVWLPATFSLADLERACPGVSRDMIRRVLHAQREQTVACIGRGPGALWQKR